MDLDGGKARGRCACCALVVVSVPFFCSIHPYLLVTPRYQLSSKSDVLSSLCPNTYPGGTSATSFFSSASTYTSLQIERLRFMTYALISALLPPTSQLEPGAAFRLFFTFLSGSKACLVDKLLTTLSVSTQSEPIFSPHFSPNRITSL